ncbi:hypothetical protein D7Z26_02655 [Cohnella endophytica]|uniref:Uncharacterized protein n=1 Tax=Cohnella endophytica TaxID=2419778 RepID=A0A494YBQ1_9BACL|nr:hypothetical protein D7Z26_02655 [Cohnella endophytica]
MSLKQLRLVSQVELTRRLEPVKTLKEDELEMYRVVKDRETGEHYLHFAAFHIHVAGGGVEEEYHHLMPLDHDDVIALALGSPLFVYPEHWTIAYLRNGPDGGFVWYDPDGAANEETEAAETEKFLREQLLEFRASGKYGEEEVRRLLESIDQRLPPLGEPE